MRSGRRAVPLAGRAERKGVVSLVTPERDRELRPVAGATVVVCDGGRCRTLRTRTDTGVADGEASTLLGALAERVRRTRKSVLIRSECLGTCSQAPAVLLIPDAATAAGLLYGPVESPDQVRALLDALSVETGA